MPGTWLEMARESREAANQLVASNFRSAVSRAYYAVYAKISHELSSLGACMPAEREGPSHRALRPMIEANLTRIDRQKRIALSRLVGRLYTLRVDADYKPSVATEAREAREAVSMMKSIFEEF